MPFWKFLETVLMRPSTSDCKLDRRPACEELDPGDGTTGLVLHGYYMPEEILRIILSYVDAKSLLKCRRVCKYWKFEIDNEVWKYKVRQEECLSISAINTLANSVPNSWLEFYFISMKKPFGTNLVRNNCGQDKLKHWEVLSNGGDQWLIENPPVGTDAMPKDATEIKKQFCFVTSYYSCSKQQVIELKKAGSFSPQLIDALRPIIEISEWYAGRMDCGCIYELKVALLDENLDVVKEFEHRVTLAPGEGVLWQKVSHKFKDYGPGVRYVSFYHGGSDSQFWSGHYGSKMTGACVSLHLRPVAAASTTEPSDDYEATSTTG